MNSQHLKLPFGMVYPVDKRFLVVRWKVILTFVYTQCNDNVINVTVDTRPKYCKAVAMDDEVLIWCEVFTRMPMSFTWLW